MFWQKNIMKYLSTYQNNFWGSHSKFLKSVERLIRQVEEDKLIEKNGSYSVKNSYSLCVEYLVDTSHLRRPGYWSGIWHLKVPPKL